MFELEEVSLEKYNMTTWQALEPFPMSHNGPLLQHSHVHAVACEAGSFTWTSNIQIGTRLIGKRYFWQDFQVSFITHALHIFHFDWEIHTQPIQ